MDRSALQEQVKKVCESAIFAQKPQLRTLLTILAEHYNSQAMLQPAQVIEELWPNDDSKESKDLAASVYRLRGALAGYYAEKGASDETVISLPRRAGEKAEGDRSRRWINAEFRTIAVATAPIEAEFAAARDPLLPFHQEEPHANHNPNWMRRQSAHFGWLMGFRLWITTGAVVALLIAAVYFTHRARGGVFFPSGLNRVSASSKQHVVPSEVEALYLRGRYFWNLRTADGLAEALKAYTQAIVRDPDYAEAYAGLAETYDLLPQFGQADMGDSFAKAKEASDRAIALKPDLASAHNAKAFALFYWDWDIAGSDAEFRKALALDPNAAQTHHWYASTLEDRLEGRECLKQIDEALRLSPTSAAVAADAAFFHANFDDFGSGIKALKAIEQTQPTLATPSYLLKEIDFALGEFPEYVEEARRYAAITRSQDDVALARAVSRGWNREGKTGLLEARAKALKAAFERGNESGFFLGETLLLLGRRKEALPYFIASLNKRNILLITMEDCPWAKPLSEDPAYAAFFAQIRERLHSGSPAHTSIPAKLRLPF